MTTTADPNDPALAQIGPDGMQAAYLVLSDDERLRGFVRPIRYSYLHLVCGTVTTMGSAIAETYARQPNFYGATYCSRCHGHYPVGEKGQFVWMHHGVRTDVKVGM